MADQAPDQRTEQTPERFVDESGGYALMGQRQVLVWVVSSCRRQ
jgi:hypothetical protein